MEIDLSSQSNNQLLDLMTQIVIRVDGGHEETQTAVSSEQLREMAVHEKLALLGQVYATIAENIAATQEWA